MAKAPTSEPAELAEKINTLIAERWSKHCLVNCQPGSGNAVVLNTHFPKIKRVTDEIVAKVRAKSEIVAARFGATVKNVDSRKNQITITIIPGKSLGTKPKAAPSRRVRKPSAELEEARIHDDLNAEEGVTDVD